MTALQHSRLSATYLNYETPRKLESHMLVTRRLRLGFVLTGNIGRVFFVFLTRTKAALSLGAALILGRQFHLNVVHAFPLRKRHLKARSRHIFRLLDFLVAMHVAWAVSEDLGDRDPDNHLSFEGINQQWVVRFGQSQVPARAADEPAKNS
jgi:hypothetical protein